MKTLVTDVAASAHAERIAEMGAALAKEYDLADKLGKALRNLLITQSNESRVAADEALDEWEEARRG